MMELITSAQNTRLKLVRRLESRRGRMAEGAFAVEGEDLVAAGVAADWPLRFALCDADNMPPGDLLDQLLAGSCAQVQSNLFAAVSTMGHAPRIIGVFDLPDAVVFDRGASQSSLPTLFLDGLRDPGNVGTVLRTASALGVHRVVIGPGTADPFSPKATRASMGAVFIVQIDEAATVDEVCAEGQPVVALDSEHGTPIWSTELGEAPVICIGSERTGVSEQVAKIANIRITIPQTGEIDSMNAGVAASIALYELARRRALPASYDKAT